MGKPTATEIIANKFWIIRYNTNKIGTLSSSDNNNFSYFEIATSTTSVLTNTKCHAMFEFVSSKASVQLTQDLGGLPVLPIELFNISAKDGLHIFSKSAQSTIFYAAGYFALDYPKNGWTNSFCPKVTTLEKFKWQGPFKMQDDMNLAIKRMNY